MSDDGNNATEPHSLLGKAALAELGASLLQLAVMPGGLSSTPVEDRGPGRARPVVLVHGWGAARTSMLGIHVALRLSGFDRVYGFFYSSEDSSGGIEAIAEKLAGYVGRVREACGGRQTVDLVCHSLGGLAARYFLQNLGGNKLVDQCITIATPHGGSYASYWVPTAVGRQLRPESEFIRELNAPGHRAPGVRFHSFGAALDLMVLPRESALYYEGSARMVPGAGHNGILLNPQVLRETCERLSTGQDVVAPAAARAISAAVNLVRRLRQGI